MSSIASLWPSLRVRSWIAALAVLLVAATIDCAPAGAVEFRLATDGISSPGETEDVDISIVPTSRPVRDFELYLQYPRSVRQTSSRFLIEDAFVVVAGENCPPGSDMCTQRVRIALNEGLPVDVPLLRLGFAIDDDETAGLISIRCQTATVLDPGPAESATCLPAGFRLFHLDVTSPDVRVGIGAEAEVSFSIVGDLAGVSSIFGNIGLHPPALISFGRIEAGVGFVPDCTSAHPDLDSFSFSPSGCTPGVDCQHLYLLLRDPFPDGPLFRCRVKATPDAAPGVERVDCGVRDVLSARVGSEFIDVGCDLGDIEIARGGSLRHDVAATAPGGVAVVEAVLLYDGTPPLGALGVDLAFDPDEVTAGDCEAFGASGSQPLFATNVLPCSEPDAPAACRGDTDRESLRLSLVSLGPGLGRSDGLVYRCSFTVSEALRDGDRVDVFADVNDASDTGLEPVAIVAGDVAIAVAGIRAQLALGTATPGGTLSLDVSLATQGLTLEGFAHRVCFDPALLDFDPASDCAPSSSAASAFAAITFDLQDDVDFPSACLASPLPSQWLVVSGSASSPVSFSGPLYSCTPGLRTGLRGGTVANFFHVFFDPSIHEGRRSLGWEATAARVSRCSGDANGDGAVTVDEIVRAVDEALAGCSDGIDRFVDRGTGTIEDRATGLVWEKKGRAGVVHADQRYTFGLDRLQQNGTLFTSFLPALNGAQWGGYSDWRVPRVHEWLTIIDTEVPARGLRPPFWTDCGAGCTPAECDCASATSASYWSATGFIDDGILAWRPQGLDSNPSPETERLSARAVRGPLWTGVASRWLCPADASGDGQVTVDEIIAAVDDALSGCPAPTERLVDHGDGTLTDRLTGLMWQRKEQVSGVLGVDDVYTWCADVDGDERCDDPSAPPDGTLFTEFLPMVNALAIGGHQDWRLPTLEEAEDFVFALNASAGRVQPIAGCDPLCVLGKFPIVWTGQTAPDDPAYAIVVAWGGAIVPLEKAQPQGAWAVREDS